LLTASCAAIQVTALVVCRAILFVGPAHHDPEGIGRQRSLQSLRFIHGARITSTASNPNWPLIMPNDRFWKQE